MPAHDRTAEDLAPRPGPFVLGNRPALTGIRAIALSLVLIFHSNFQTLPGSWVSLGVFFVLSGFLITTMLAKEHQKTGRISLGAFYSRRAVRLLPPLVMTVVLLGLYALVVPVGNAGNRIWGDSASALFYVSDYRSAFFHEPNLGFLAQCWSLAVEEQFYLVWAALLVAALTFGNRRLAYALALTGVVASVANRVWLVLGDRHWGPVSAARVYYAFDTRADALFVGCLLGLLATGGHLDNWRPWAKQTLVAAALASTAAMVWIILNVTLAPRSLPLVWLPVSEVASAVIIVYFIIHPSGWGTRLAGLSVFVFIGNMSYTIYLVHWPVYVAISPYTVRWSYATTELVRLAVIVPLAMASWYLMEKPLMNWRRRTLDPAGRVAADRVSTAGPAPPVPAGAARPPVSVPSRPSPVLASTAVPATE